MGGYSVLTNEENKRRMELYRKGLNDKEMGDRLFLTPTTIV